MRAQPSRVFVSCAALFALFTACATQAQTSPAPAPTGDLRGDLKIFRSQVVDADVAYSPTNRAEARARLDALATNLDRMDALQVEVEFCRILALANNPHTACLRGLSAPAVDANFYPLDGRIYVFSASAAEGDLVGGRLIDVDGQSFGEVRDKVRSLSGGRPGWRDLRTNYVYSNPAILHALGVARRADAAVYRIQTLDGRIVERRLATSAPTARGPIKVLIAPERTPWIWRDMNDPFRFHDAPAHDAFIVQVRANVDLPGRPIGAFLAEVERQRGELRRKTVILDMRSNTGGDMMLTREFFAGWPAHVGSGARFLVLLGPRSLSAALADVAYLKQAGGAEVTILGQSPGDGMTFFAETAQVRLPGTGLVVQKALERDDLKNGCRHFGDCFAGLAQPGGPTATPAHVASLIKRMPVSVPTLEPDVPVPAKIEDYVAGKDSTLHTALELAMPCAQAVDPAVCEAESRELAGPMVAPPS